MQFKSLNLKLITLCVAVLIAFFWVMLKQDKGGDVVDSSPLAMKIFDFCIDAVVTNQPISEDEIVDRLKHNKEEDKDYPPGTVTYLEVAEDFKCYLEIDKAHYQEKELYRQMEILKASSLNGRADKCHLKTIQAPLANKLTCSISHEPNIDGITTIYNVEFVIVANQGAYFRTKPHLQFDKDGFVSIAD